MRNERRLHGFWRHATGTRRPGVLLLTERGETLLQLSGSFPNFRSYESAARGAKANRNLICGTTADGRRITLVDCVEGTTRRHFDSRKRHYVETEYSAGWFLVGAHFTAYDDLRFIAIGFQCDHLNDLLGASHIRRQFLDGGDGFRLSYRRPRDLTFSLGDFRLRFSQSVRIPFMDSVAAAEQGFVTIQTKEPRHFDAFWNGPVRAVRSLLAFFCRAPPGCSERAREQQPQGAPPARV